MPASEGVYLDSSYGLHYSPGMTQVDGVPEELLRVINEHWRQFPPNHPFIQHIFGTLFFFLWAISMIGNGIVMYIFVKVKYLRTPSNMLVVSLALSDFCMMLTMGLPMVVNMFLSHHWAFGARLCEWYGFLGGVFGLASLWLIIMIGYDRYNVIVKGFNGVKITPAIAMLMILFSFGVAVAVCIPPLLNLWGAYTLEGLLLTCSFDYLTQTTDNITYSIFITVGCYVFPMLFVVYFYSQIVAAVVSHERALRAQAKKMNVESLRSNEDKNAESAEVRIAKVAITNVMVWIIAWTPYMIVCQLGLYGGKHLLTPVVTQMPSFFAKTASVFNPIIYAVSHPKFRLAMTTEMPCCGIKESEPAENTEMKTVKAEAS